MALKVIFILLFAFLVYYCICMVVSESEEKIKRTLELEDYNRIHLEHKEAFCKFMFYLGLDDENRKLIDELELEEKNRKHLKLLENIRKNLKLAQEEKDQTWLSKFWS